jgi:sterol 3beta-glucosyltransferase
MNILIITLGSRGDVQPYVALGKGLKTAGHQVTLCTSSSFKSFVTEHGLSYGYMNNDLVEMARSDVGRNIMENANSVFKIIITSIKLFKLVTPMQRAMLKDSWEAAQKCGPDLIIFHPKAYGGAHFAEKLKVSSILAIPLPMLTPTSEFANIGFPAWKLGRSYNRITHFITLKILDNLTRMFIKRWRQEEALPPLPRGRDFLHTAEGKQIPVMHCYSAHVGPTPADWPITAAATGYWFLDHLEDWQPPKGLVDFLEAGNPPVYVGFGSIAGRNPEKVTRVVIEALA